MLKQSRVEELTPAMRNGKIAKNFQQDGNATITKYRTVWSPM